MHCTAGGHLGCFHFEAVINNASVNLLVHVFFVKKCFCFCWVIPTSATGREYGMFRFGRYHLYLFPMVTVINYHKIGSVAQ